MDSNMPAGRVWCFTLLFLSYIIFTTSIVTQDPVLACVGDTITVSCDLTVPNPGDIFVSSITDFIIGNSVPLGDTIVNGNGILGDVNLSRFTADSPIGSTENLLGTLTLLSYTLADNGLTLGCTNEYLVDGNSSNRASLAETLNIQQANPPSPVSLSADFDSTTCSGSVELAWTAGASDRPIETYFLYLNGVDIASISSPMNSYSHAITLQIDTDYVYSVLAMSCAGNSTLATADTITIGAPPSSPNVTLSQANTNCSNVNISWNTPNSDKLITEYSVYRNDTFLATVMGNEANQYTDTDQLTINTVYEYSVTAVSCAGNSTPGVMSVRTGGYSLSVSVNALSYVTTSDEITFSWTLSTNTEKKTLLLSYLLELYYSYSQDDSSPYNSSQNYSFSQLSNNTEYYITITQYNVTTNSSVDTEITICLQITQQCGNFSGERLCAEYDSEPHPTESSPPSLLGLIVGGVIGGILFILLILLIILLIIGVCICCLKNGAGYSIFGAKKKDKNSNQLTLEETFYTKVEKSGKAPPAETEQKQILYADIDHITPKPGSVKRPEPTEETHYMSIQPPIDGPST